MSSSITREDWDAAQRRIHELTEETRRLTEALRHCWNVVGPLSHSARECLSCEGCQYEWNEALYTISETLGFDPHVYPAPESAVEEMQDGE